MAEENELVGEQRKFLQKIAEQKGNLYVSGFPGSGKSVCLIYAVEKIRKLYPNATILFVEFTHSLIKMIEASLAKINVTDIRVVTFANFKKNYRGIYDFIICDEIQDSTKSLLELMKQRAKRVIVGGDSNQSIYQELDNEPTLKQEEILKILSIDSSETDQRFHQLTIIHRLSKYVIKGISSFLPEMKILAAKTSMIKKHKPIYLWRCLDNKDEVKRIMTEAKKALNNGESVAILFQFHNQIEKFINIYLQTLELPLFDFAKNQFNGKPNYSELNNYLEKNEVKLQSITNGAGTLVSDAHKIIISTYHSSKGLDFKNVYLPFCNYSAKFPDDNSDETKEFKRLFMVAMTRSWENLFISYTGNMNICIQKFYNDKQACAFTDYKDVSKQQDHFPEPSDDDDW